MEHSRRSVNDEDLDRFEVFFRENYQRVFQYVARRVPNSHVDDVVAASFMVAWRKFERASNPALPWLLRIASYEVSNHRRSSRKWNNVVSIDMVSEYLPTSTAGHVDGTEIRSALGRLSDADQEILRLVHWDSLTRAEVAEVLRLTPNATNVRYHRALQRLLGQMPSTSPRLRTDDGYPTHNSIPIKGVLP
jgi:RNA polymerase sigma-70 factor (ECF subfamily)